MRMQATLRRRANVQELFDTVWPSNVHSPSTQIPKSNSNWFLQYSSLRYNHKFCLFPHHPGHSTFHTLLHLLPCLSLSPFPSHVISRDSLMYLLAGEGPLVPLSHPSGSKQRDLTTRAAVGDGPGSILVGKKKGRRIPRKSRAFRPTASGSTPQLATLFVIPTHFIHHRHCSYPRHLLHSTPHLHHFHTSQLLGVPLSYTQRSRTDILDRFQRKTRQRRRGMGPSPCSSCLSVATSYDPRIWVAACNGTTSGLWTGYVCAGHVDGKGGRGSLTAGGEDKEKEMPMGPPCLSYPRPCSKLSLRCV
jgi:hypothetical protein